MAGRADRTGNASLYSVPDIDRTKASIARVYDYILGGKDHFEVDRRATDAMYAVDPNAGHLARDNRNFLRRAVPYLVRDVGIRQIIDIGSGLPTVGNVHEIAHRIDRNIRVVYVDNDPVVIVHGRALLSRENTSTVIAADARIAESIFDDPDVAELIDFDEPLAVIAASVLHHLTDDDVYPAVEAIRERLSPGSHMLISHFLDDDEDRAKALEKAFLEGGLGTGRFRTWEDMYRMFEGLEMLEPGLVYCNDWHADRLTPTDSAVHTLLAAGLARKPG
ncbi:SAM-dependent methyltransferase [Pseudonocardia alaniniphila]|uniref:SAM-dependent methyltransferase n=1 Tax=Pseudonocardia alaniniphila TaxID=75291 RepID=A0ABS9THI5_9PSEU|nr:SAM-dependent methyltransferase [Pseudonocardia alaniniphila]MCH6167989.1 SAM-dependent methyltransferase [Pseudonocardia alaniniphila]